MPRHYTHLLTCECMKQWHTENLASFLLRKKQTTKQGHLNRSYFITTITASATHNTKACCPCTALAALFEYMNQAANHV